jgi:hypothetical protein
VKKGRLRVSFEPSKAEKSEVTMRPATTCSSPISLWHHRVLGGLWATGVFLFIWNLISKCSWSEGRLWIAAFIGAIYISASIGLIFCYTWARRVMRVLVIVAGLVSLDLMFMFGWGNNRAGVWAMLAAFGFAVYTSLFLQITSGSRYKDSRREIKRRRSRFI